MTKWFSKLNYQIRVLQYFFLAVTLYGLFTAPWAWIIVGGLAYVFLETIGGNIALHRYYGHRSFKTTPGWERVFRFFGHYVGVGSIISWVGQHRHHHKHSDKEGDVHDFRAAGLWHILFGVWHVSINRSLIRDVIRDEKLMWWHERYWKFHILLILFYTAIDLYFGTYTLFALYAFPNLMCLMSGYVLIVLTHYHGYQRYETADHSTNSWLANILTLGEGWHNNHHAYPSRINQGEEWWEWELPLWVIRTFMEKKPTTT